MSLKIFAVLQGLIFGSPCDIYIIRYCRECLNTLKSVYFHCKKCNRKYNTYWHIHTRTYLNKVTEWSVSEGDRSSPSNLLVLFSSLGAKLCTNGERALNLPTSCLKSEDRRHHFSPLLFVLRHPHSFYNSLFRSSASPVQRLRPLASLGGIGAGGPPRVTPSRGWHPIKLFVAEFRKNTG